MIDEEIKDVVVLAQKVIINYLSPLDAEKKKIVDDVFSQTSVFYDDLEANGFSDYIDKKIVIWKYLKYNYERVLSYLIHEYFHMLVNRDFKLGEGHMDTWLEEGLADTFSDLAINEYFKYHSEKINGRMLHFDFPYISLSGYIIENSFVRTLLYPLSIEGKDKEAIKEMLLGSPKKFVEMVCDKETSEKITYTKSGYPIKLFVTDRSIYQNKFSYYQNIDKNSIYYINNSILHRYEINEKIQDINVPKIYELAKDEYYSDEFIKCSYFDNLLICYIRPEELKHFLELYFNSRLPNDSFFLDDAYYIFIDKQMNYILENKGEIINNIDNFLDVMPYFISKENKMVGNNVYSVIAICLSEILKKIDKLEYNDSYIHTIYFKLKNIVIPVYESLSNVLINDQYHFIMELFNACLKNIESKIMTFDSLIKILDKSKIIGCGTSKKCYDLGNMVLLVENEYKKFNLDNYYFLNKLINNGVLTPKIISESTTKSEHYILEEKIEGTPLQDYSVNMVYPVETEDDILENYYSEKKYVKKYLSRLKELSQKPGILEKFVNDYFTIIQSGGVVDPSKTTNFIYNDRGIYFLDISLNSSNIKMDEHYIFNYILYNISWCQSSCFDDDDQKEEAIYLKKIIKELKEICLKRNLNLNEYFIDYNGKSLLYKVGERFKYRDEYKITSEDEYIEQYSFKKRI